MKVKINVEPVEYRIEGDSIVPEDRVLLADDQDLTSETAWASDGYVVADFLSPAEHETFHRGMEALVRQALVRIGQPVGADWPLADYHRLVGSDQNLHLAMINETKEYALEALPIPVRCLEARVSELCGRPVKVHNPHNGQQAFHLRIVRPGRPDNNPLHRDAWLDRLRDGINIYVPIAGSTEQSSLSLVPGSHWWSEARTERTLSGAVYNGVTYSVPAVKSATEPLHLIRPNPGANEVLVFSPYLLHGGAVNLSPDQTRISLEMRFWKA